jgi:hypothetical protein
MKASHGFNRTRFFSIVRIATAATLISAAAVMAVILGTEALVTVGSPPSLAEQNLQFVPARASTKAALSSEASLLGDLARQKRFLPASVKAAPNLKCKLHGAGREPGSGITVYTDADGYARFHAVRGGQGQTELLTCTDEAGHTSSYRVDLSSAATFADRPRDLAREPGTDRPPLTGDPSSYTQGQLARMGYGLRPDRYSPAYAGWLAAATKPGRILYTKRLSDLQHGVTPTTAAPWIGSVMTGAAPYDSITTTFQVPTAIPGAEGTTVTAAIIWPGLGGFNTGSGLIQAGVEIQTTTTTASYVAWREYCCGDPDSNGYAGAFVPSPGDKILAQVWYCDANGQVNLNGGFGCSYLYDFQSGAVFNCTTPRGNGNNPPCWSVKALPLCSVSPTTPFCMTLGMSAEVIVENASGFPGFTPSLAMDGVAGSVSQNSAVTVNNDPAVFLLRDYPHGPPHVLVSLTLLGDTCLMSIRSCLLSTADCSTPAGTSFKGTGGLWAISSSCPRAARSSGSTSATMTIAPCGTICVISAIPRREGN